MSNLISLIYILRTHFLFHFLCDLNFLKERWISFSYTPEIMKCGKNKFTTKKKKKDFEGKNKCFGNWE